MPCSMIPERELQDAAEGVDHVLPCLVTSASLAQRPPGPQAQTRRSIRPRRPRTRSSSEGDRSSIQAVLRHAAHPLMRSGDGLQSPRPTRRAPRVPRGGDRSFAGPDACRRMGAGTASCCPVAAPTAGLRSPTPTGEAARLPEASSLSSTSVWSAGLSTGVVVRTPGPRARSTRKTHLRAHLHAPNATPISGHIRDTSAIGLPVALRQKP